MGQLRSTSRDFARDFAYELALDFGLEFARDFAFEFAMDFALDFRTKSAHEFAFSVARDFARYFARGAALDFSLDGARDSALEFALYFPRSYALDFARDVALSLELPTTPELIDVMAFELRAVGRSAARALLAAARGLPDDPRWRSPGLSAFPRFDPSATEFEQALASEGSLAAILFGPRWPVIWGGGRRLVTASFSKRLCGIRKRVRSRYGQGFSSSPGVT